ncbi:hypothetical protein KY290_027554 [Solanum tuberosum]|uniref:Uncharacterized protein n=1 Tax=Solanum tuberosum TaxID=4113 RepID=A0ABQ7UFI0_SOLTU|nr:hypothetical protein KY289_026802 [Solanum tuberosum]KAH0665290.1 hypothetical protein KY285_026496 [Solanum tuberosum]KAH0748322.1 hypothetical protein KY290_027554 [Solanum tuberosum]
MNEEKDLNLDGKYANGGFIIRTGPGCLIELIKFDMGGLSWLPFDRARMKFLTLEGKGVVNVGVLI